MKRLFFSILPILFPSFLFCQKTCDAILNKLIDQCDITLNKVLSGTLDDPTKNAFVKQLEDFIDRNCFDAPARNITRGFIQTTKIVPAPFNQRDYEGIKKVYDEKLSIYTNKLLIYRQYLQTLLLENTIKNYDRKINQFLIKDSIFKYNDSIFKFKDSIHKKMVRDSLIEILQILRGKSDSSSTNPTTIFNSNYLLLILESQTKIIIDTVKKIFNNNRNKIEPPHTDFWNSKSKDIIGISAFQNSLYGILYYRKINSKNSISWMIGPEIIFPINSQLTSNPGFFLVSSVQDRKLMLQVALGWIKNVSPNDVSWKCGIVYYPSKIGVGISYSPITGFGTNINLKLQ